MTRRPFRVAGGVALVALCQGCGLYSLARFSNHSLLAQKAGGQQDLEAAVRHQEIAVAASVDLDAEKRVGALATLGLFQLRAGALPAAVATFEEMLAAQRSRLRADHADLLAAARLLVSMTTATGQLPAARRQARDFLGYVGAQLGAGHGATLEPRALLAETLVELGGLAEARGHYQAVLDAVLEPGRRDDALHMKARRGLALTARQDWDFGEAERQLRAGLAALETSGKDLPELEVPVGAELAGTLVSRGRLGEAEALLERAQGRLPGIAAGPERAAAERSCAAARAALAEARGDLAAALRELEACARRDRALFDVEFLGDRLVRLRQATVHLRAGEVEPARGIVTRDLAGLEAVADSAGTSWLVGLEADCHLALADGDHARARSRAEAYLHRVAETYGGAHPQRAPGLELLARAHLAGGRAAEALPVIEEALEIERAAGIEASLQHARSLRTRDACLEALGRRAP